MDVTVERAWAAAACGIPYRQVSRWQAEMALSGIAAAARLMPAGIDAGVVTLLLLRNCLPDWVGADGLRVPGAPTRTSSVNALAASSGRPYENRRHVRTLVDDGMFVERRGVAIAPAAAPRVFAYLKDAHDILLRYVADLRAIAQVPAPRVSPAPDLTARIMTVALDIFLQPIENFRDPLVDWSSMFIWNGISVANVRTVTTDPALATRYAVESTPDSLRRPVSLAGVSAMIGLSYSTVWRKACAMEERDVLSRDDRGWLVRTDQLREEATEAHVRQAVRYCVRRVSDLVTCGGLDPAGIDARYYAGRPPWVPLAST